MTRTSLLSLGCCVALVSSCREEAVLAIAGGAPTTARQALTANIHPAAIQIDGPASGSPGADLFANVGTPLNTGATADWVKDSLANSGTSCLGTDGIATCIEAGVTGATGGTGHWNGVRIVDGLNSADQDIFLTGGKENDTSTWNPGPGSVGSSKYDVTQAYLANNQTTLFFGMERSGNNGTTAFDFEFNQKAPESAGCPQNPLIPCRTNGDVLFTFEMQGAGNTGSATPTVFTWNGTSYVAQSPLPTGVFSSINNSTSTANAPWGHVDSKGNWVNSNLDRFAFAEAAAPLSLLPGVSACGGTAYVQVRTRSSSQSTSDLKDLTKIFEFQFNGISADAVLTPTCDGSFDYTIQNAKGPDGSDLTDPTCSWTFSDGSTSDLCSGTITGLDPGSYSGTVTVSASSSGTCTVDADAPAVDVLGPIDVTLTLRASPDTCPTMASDAVTYDAVVNGGDSNYTYQWTGVSGCSGASCTINPDDTDFCASDTLSVTVDDGSSLCPPATSEEETYSKVTVITASDN